MEARVPRWPSLAASSQALPRSGGTPQAMEAAAAARCLKGWKGTGVLLGYQVRDFNPFRRELL